MVNALNGQYITELNNIQEKERFHLANKLKKIYILFQKQKTKVKLAV